MGEIIDFSKYREQLESSKNTLSAVLREKGADSELINFAEKRAKELFEFLNDHGQYRFPITLPASLSAEEQERVATQVKAGIESVRESLGSAAKKLAVRALLADLKVFQYERMQNKSF